MRTGECAFIPSFWWHHATSLTLTLTLTLALALTLTLPLPLALTEETTRKLAVCWSLRLPYTSCAFEVRHDGVRAARSLATTQW